MNTKNYIVFFVIMCLGIFASCNDYLGFEKPGQILLEDAFITSDDAIASVTAAYVPLMWEFNTGAGGTYFPEWWIGDVCSDDALKGGETVTGDMAMVYSLENFKTESDNTVLYQFYRAPYVGIMRCNVVFENVPLMENSVFTSTPGLRERILGEAYFLRAFYYFRLVRVFGGVPWIDRVIKIQEDWKQPRATEQEIYEHIYADLQEAIRLLPNKSGYKVTDAGRATKGAARALLMKAYMNNRLYDLAKLQADSIINVGPDAGQYTLTPEYKHIFTIEAENNSESVFETQYMVEATSDYGQGVGYTRGTFAVVMTRPRWASVEGWAFNRPTQELYNEFEPDDPRLDAAIMLPGLADLGGNDFSSLKGTINDYMGNFYTARKYAWTAEDLNPDGSYYFFKLEHHTRGPVNRREIRYSDVLLMYAEACCKASTPDYGQAKWALEKVRARARGGNAGILPEFPNYRGYQNTPDDLYKAIQHERRVELAMEGHRWFDLKRWGILAETMRAYKEENQRLRPVIASHMADFVKGKHELFPIPLQERDLNSPMSQNPGYDGAPIP